MTTTMEQLLIVSLLLATSSFVTGGGFLPLEEVCFPVADVVFLLDGSDSISDLEFTQQKDFLRRFVKMSEVGPEKIRVGYAVVSSTIGDNMGLAGTTTKRQVLDRVKSIAQPQEGSRIDLGLVQLEQMLLAEGRKGESQIGVILTDGRAKYERATEGEAVAVKSAGTFLIAVGVGRLIQDAELEKIASTPSDAYHLTPMETSLKMLTETVNYLGREWCAGVAQLIPELSQQQATHTSEPTTPVPTATPETTTTTTTTTPTTTTTTTTRTPPTTTTTIPTTTSTTTKPTTTESTTTTHTTTAAAPPQTTTQRRTRPSTTTLPRTASTTATTKAQRTMHDILKTSPLAALLKTTSFIQDSSFAISRDRSAAPSSGATSSKARTPSRWGVVAHKLFDLNLPLAIPTNFKFKDTTQRRRQTAPPTPTTTTLRPVTTTHSDTDGHGHNSSVAARMCRNSRFVDGVGYAFHANSCTEFLQCFYDDGHVHVEIARCPFRTFFDEGHMICRPYDQRSCYRDPCFDFNVESYAHTGNCRAHWSCATGLSRPKCCPLGYSFSPGIGCVPNATCTDPCVESGELTFNTPFSSCRMTPLETNNQFYFEKIPGLGMMIRTCPRGSRFAASLCTCDTTDSVIKKDCRAKMYVDFNDGFMDRSGNNLAVSHTNVIIEQGAGRFDGYGNMKLWRFSGVSFGHNLVITLKFKVNSTEHQGKPMHLISNCCHGCGGSPGPSIDIVVVPDRIGGIMMFSAVTEKSGEIFVDVPYTTTESGWNEVSYNYNGQALTGQVNGLEGKQNIAGEIASREDPLTLGGACDGAGYFNGLIDDFKIYLCTPR